ncbi:MAG: AsmA-like C-terminal domain-containing protein, partial [Tepidisphaeraceae bacterium]
LGLLQITNLALPLSSPFDEATTRYAIDGQQVIFDQITLKSKQMTMTGNGQLDFAAKRVSLWFVTDNPTLVSIPLFGALLHGAKQELLRIHVGGTIDQPTVEATSFHTIRTTVDQVLSDGDGK